MYNIISECSGLDCKLLQSSSGHLAGWCHSFLKTPPPHIDVFYLPYCCHQYLSAMWNEWMQWLGLGCSVSSWHYLKPFSRLELFIQISELIKLVKWVQWPWLQCLHCSLTWVSTWIRPHHHQPEARPQLGMWPGACRQAGAHNLFLLSVASLGQPPKNTHFSSLHCHVKS